MRMPPFDMDKAHTFDLECTTQEPTYCWLAASTPLNNATLEGTALFRNIHDLMEYIFHWEHDCHRFYAHNLSYDMSFILAYLNTYHKDDFTYTNLIHPPMGSLMAVTIEWRSVKIFFFDTVVKFACPLAKVLEVYTDWPKGETPIYPTLEDVVHCEYNDTYCKIDACGLAQALPFAMEAGTSLTIPSDAMKKWRDLMVEKHGRAKANARYSPIPIEVDDVMRDAYRGGFTFVHPGKKDTVLRNVVRYDVNSMYPAQMRLKLLPFGKPKEVKKGAVKPYGSFQLGIQIFTFQFAEIKDGCCPFVATSKGFKGANEYASEIIPKPNEERVRLLLTCQEFELFLQHYDVKDISLEGGWLFRASKGDFVQYIDEFWEMKSSSDPTLKNRGKLFLNSLYGKFAENPRKQPMAYDLDSDIVMARPIDCEPEIAPKGYLPLGIFITSYARCQLIETIQLLGYDNFVYCDTDSIHVLGPVDESKLDVDGSRIGAWDKEGVFVKAKYLRAKRYMGIDDKGKAKVVCAGINKNDLSEQVTDLEGFYSGRLINTRKFKNGVNGKHVKPQTTKI